MARTRATCTICGEIARARGLCHMHYARWKRHGDPLHTKIARVRKPRTCELCESPHYARGLCMLHWERQRRHGDPTVRLTRSGETITTGGYRRIYVNGESVLEHRHVAEQMLGRPLHVSEIVHHINRDQLDNRPENLQVLDRSAHGELHHREGDFPERLRLHQDRPCVVCGAVPTKARALCGTHHSAWLRGYISVDVPASLR